MVLLGVWTLIEAYTLGVVCAALQRSGAGEVVFQAFIITAAIFVGLSLFTLYSKIDFSWLGAVCFAGLLGLLAWGLIIWVRGSTVMDWGRVEWTGGGGAFDVMHIYADVCTHTKQSDKHLRQIMGWRQSFIYSLIGAILFSLLIVYDTFILSKKLSPDEYILGAISLYLDIVNLFLFLIQLLGGRRE